MADDARVWKDPQITMVRALLAQLRPKSETPLPWPEQRAGMDAFGAMAILPDGLGVETLDIDGLPAERLTPAGDHANHLLYLHGGGYCVGSPTSHRGLIARLAGASGAVALSPDYRLAPEHPFPAAVDDALKAYRHLLASGADPARIAVAGDSAGGGLTLALAVALRDAGLPHPACLFVISPWTNLAQVGAAYATVGADDPMLTREGLDGFAEAYLGGGAADRPLASPVLADLAGLPPLLIHVGAAEILLSDSVALAERAGLAGVQTQLEVWPEMIHVWHAFSDHLDAGRRAIDAAGAWMAGRLAT
jgi:acetyl esterase/lipase